MLLDLMALAWSALAGHRLRTALSVVGVLGILTMMWISVGERVSEIGLLRAMGAQPRQIFLIFIVESVMLAVLGGILGVFVGMVGAFSLTVLLPGLPVFVDGSVEKSRQRRSRQFPVLTYEGYAPRLKWPVALLDGLF